MLDWLASVAIVRRSERRIELGLHRATAWAGWMVTLVGGLAALFAATISIYVAGVACVVAAFGLLLGTVRRRLIFDRDEGLLRIEQRVLGLRSRAAVPLFHLRAVVISAQPSLGQLHGHRYVAYVERRVGGRIHLDESRRCAALLALAEAVSEVAQLRLVYDATILSQAR